MDAKIEGIGVDATGLGGANLHDVVSTGCTRELDHDRFSRIVDAHYVERSLVFSIGFTSDNNGEVFLNKCFSVVTIEGNSDLSLEDW